MPHLDFDCDKVYSLKNRIQDREERYRVHPRPACYNFTKLTTVCKTKLSVLHKIYKQNNHFYTLYYMIVWSKDPKTPLDEEE